MAKLQSKRHEKAEVSLADRRQSLSYLDTHTIAVILQPKGGQSSGKQFVFLGTASYQRDDVLGSVLIVSASDPESAGTKLIFSEQEWKGRVIPDLKYGCKFCMIPQA